MSNTTLGKIANIITGPFGSQLHMEDYVEEGIPVIMPQNISDRRYSIQGIAKITKTDYIRLQRYAVQKNDIVFARRGDVEKHAFITDDTPALCGTGCLRVRVISEEVYPAYLSLYLNKPETRKWLATHAVGSNMPNLNTDILASVPVSFPSYSEQVRQAKFLQMIDDKIFINNRINDNLQQMAKTIYDYWFTQFDFPDENGNPYRSSGGKMVWNDELKREIPVGWSVKNLLKVVSWESNSQPPKSDFIYEPREGYVRFIQNRDYDSDNHITYIPYSKNLSIVSRYDILMDKYGDAGTVRYGIEGAFNVALGKISTNELDFQEYLRSFLESDGVYNYLHNSCMASTRASLSESNLSMLNIAIPPAEILKDYQQRLHRIRAAILKAKDENKKLTELRDWLLPMLMNGQATVND